jgi:SprT protein
MSKQEVPLHQLQPYLPEHCLEDVLHYLHLHKVHLIITRERRTLLGNYRNPFENNNHRITVNGNLNKYSFLITLLHELAHLFTYEKFRNKVQPHGSEWKNEYSKLLAQFLLKKIFPDDIQKALMRTLQNPSASSCADTHLLRVLHKYDEKPLGVMLVETIPEGGLFKIKGGRVFKRMEKVRKRYKCIDIKSNAVYLFSPVHEVMQIPE